MIKVDIPKIKLIEQQLGKQKNQAASILSRSINRAADNAKSNMGKKVREQYLVKDKDVKKTIKLTKANKNNLGATVKSTGYKIPLIKFKMSPKEPRPKNPPKAYKAKVKKSGSLKAILGAFVASVGGQNRVMQRKGNDRLPIKQLFGPAIPDMIGSKDVIGYIEKEAMCTLERRIDHEIKRVLGEVSK